MNEEKWHKVKQIFNEAVELSLESQSEFLDSATDDDEILAEVNNLLIADREAKSISGGIFSIPKDDFSRLERIGNYKIIREIGEGGMGAVFLASREDFEKQVAIKIIKHEFSSKDLIRRFQNERKILASLEHQNIARLFDGGATERGLPYFVMEYVEGEDLLTYCQNNNLSIEERLEVFRKICSAVSYAHGKLIVHRDLKPSNILIGKNGDPKLLDFGISKLLDEESSERTGTATVLGMMTPNYASPEQFRGETVSTSTDVYSLGVILYELLTGLLPYQISNKRIDEIARVICETEPQKPSELLTQKNPTQKTNGKINYQTSRNLRGDLDNIILKSLRKESERRYPSVEKFSEDIYRHLKGLPITARPDTFSYRAEKFIKRNRNAVLAGLLILFTLIGGIAATTWQAIRAEREKQLAEKRFQQVRELANNVVFKYHDEIKDLAGATRVRQIMVQDALKYLDNLQSEAGNDETLNRELSKAYMRIADVQGGSYQANLGDSIGALESYKKAISLLEPLVKNSTDIKLLSELRDGYLELGRAFFRTGDLENQNKYFRKTMEMSDFIVSIVPQDIEQQAFLARSYVHLADSINDNTDQKLVYFKKAYEIANKTLETKPDDETINRLFATATHRLQLHLYMQGIAEKKQKRIDKANMLFNEALVFAKSSLAAQEKVLKVSPDNARYQRNVGGGKLNVAKILLELNQVESALMLDFEALKIFQNISDKDSTNNEIKLDLKEAYEDISFNFVKQGKTEEAYKNYFKAVQYTDELLKKDPNNYEFWQGRLLAYRQFGDALRSSGDEKAAVKLYKEAIYKAENETPKNFDGLIKQIKTEMQERLVQ